MTPRDGRLRTTVAIAVLGLVLVACGGGTPSTSVGPTASPTPTPVDTAAEFLRIVGAASFSAVATITGSVTIDGTAGTVEGTLRISGTDSAAAVTTHVGGADETTEHVIVGAEAWTKAGLGPWLAAPASAGTSGGSLGTWLHALSALEAVGPETHAGRQLVHLRPTTAAQVPPEALGFDGAGLTDPEVTIDLFAEADGSPASFAIDAAWSAASDHGPTAVKLTLEYALSDVGATITIAKPSDIWSTYTSSALGYSMAMPAGWSVKETAKGDNYLINEVEYVYVYPEPDAVGLTLDEFQAGVTAIYKDQLKVGPQSVRSATLGTEPSKLLLFTWSAADGSPLALIDMVAMHGQAGWEVFMVTAGGPTLNDDATLFDTFLASFSFLK